MIIWGVIAVLAILTFVAAYYSSRNWHWANVTLGVLLFLSAVLFVVLGAKVVQIRAIYGRQYNQKQEQLQALEVQNRALQHGVRGDAQLVAQLAADEVRVPEDAESIEGIIDLNHQLHLITRMRGRVWRNAEPAGPIDPETGIVPVAVPFPTPHGIDANTIVFVFERGEPNVHAPEQGPQYIGEFRVVDVVEGGVRLQPVLQLDGQIIDRVQNTRFPWAIHETMPIDRHELFTGPDGERLPEERLRQLLPPQSVEEYVRHGTPATPDDDQWHRAAFDDTGRRLGPDEAANVPGAREVYDRPLRDYAVLFHQLAQQRVGLLANVAAVSQDIKRLKEALASARELQAYREEEIEKLKFDLAGLVKEREAIEEHLALLNRALENGRQLLERTIRENRRLVELKTAGGDGLAGFVGRRIASDDGVRN